MTALPKTERATAREAGRASRDAGVFAMLRAVLTPAERRRGRLVFLLMLGMALMEAVGVASVMPFMAVLSQPEIVAGNPYLAAAYDRLGFDSQRDFMAFLGLVVLVLFLASLAFKALTTYAITRFSSMRLHAIACRLLEAYLRQPYEFFLNRNSSDLSKAVLSEVETVTNGVLMPALRMVAGAVVAIAILILLLLVEPLLSLATGVVLGSAYGAVYGLTRRLVSRAGDDRLWANNERFRLANECLGGIKELRLLGRESSYLDRFRKPSRVFASRQATRGVLGELPQYAIQTIAFGGMLVLLLFLIRSLGSLDKALPLLSLYALAAYRLMPALQETFRNATHLRYAMPALRALYDDITQKEESVYRAGGEAGPVALRDELRFEAVTYRYPNAERPSLNGIDLAIPAGSSVAFVGSTGAGKSTAVDLILGLLRPTSGRILIDGRPMESVGVRAWQRGLGYVPQSIFLVDDTVAANIAFGVPPEEVDQAAVERAARAARIHDFIVDELPEGYRTVIGERGIRLSGGQRQRLAIARALYRDADVVVFDEATSALDGETEAAVMEAIEALHGRKTIILIAHRLSTLRHCDRLFLLKDGSLVAQGTFDELWRGNPEFARLAATQRPPAALAAAT